MPTQNPPATAMQWQGHMSDDVGATYGVEPLATLTADQNRLVLSGTRGTFEVPRSAVTRIGRGRMYPWFFAAVRIHHQIPGMSTELQFKPLSVHWRDVVKQLDALGYPVR